MTLSPHLDPAANLGSDETIADFLAREAITHFRAATPNVIAGCRTTAVAADRLGVSTPAFRRFIQFLKEAKVLSENDALSGLRANGKLSMFRKIGEHADSLLDEAMLPLLPPHYSVLYQVVLLIERAGIEFTAGYLKSLGPGFVREDIINANLPTMPNAAAPATSADNLPMVASQLFVVTPSKRDLDFFRQTYAEPSTLDQLLARPQPAESAGLVVLLPLLLLGTIERTLLPLLGFSKPARLLLLGQDTSPDITSRDVVLVADRGTTVAAGIDVEFLRQQRLNITDVAEHLFPEACQKCHLFARERRAGWDCLVDSENWIQEPSP